VVHLCDGHRAGRIPALYESKGVPLGITGKQITTMEHNNTPHKFKHVYEKNYSSSHPLYDAMKAICNPDGENTYLTKLAISSASLWDNSQRAR
jgi:hypothetical protein